MTRKVKAPEREQGDRNYVTGDYGTEDYGYKDTGQFTKIPIEKKKKVKTKDEAVTKSPKVGDGSGVPLSKAQVKKEKDEYMQMRKKLGLAEAMN